MVGLILKSVDETLVYDHSNESYWEVHLCGAVYFSLFVKMRLDILFLILKGLWAISIGIRDHLHVFTVLSTEHSFPVSLFQGTRPGECPELNPTPMCAGEITGCESDDGCSLGSRCCLQQNCTRKCVKAEIIPPPPPSKCSAQANYVLTWWLWNCV